MFFKKKLSNKDLNKINRICFIVSIIGLLFIFYKLYRYKNNALKEMYIEHLQNQENKKIDERQNITDQPSPPTEKEMSSPNYLNLTNNSVLSIKNYVNRTVAGAIKNIRPDVQGPPGKLGPKGEKGDSGGTYTSRGTIRSISNPNLFLGRNKNKVTIGPRTFRNEQHWIHSSDKKLHSVYKNTECLSATDDGKLEISSCPTAMTWEYKGGTSQLQTGKPINKYNRCLTFKNTPENGKDDQYSLSLDICANSPLCDNKNNCPAVSDQAWSLDD